jgi:hypothetical protein
LISKIDLGTKKFGKAVVKDYIFWNITSYLEKQSFTTLGKFYFSA